MELSVFLKRFTHVAFDLTNFFLFGNPYDKIRYIWNSLKHLKTLCFNEFENISLKY